MDMKNRGKYSNILEYSLISFKIFGNVSEKIN